MENDVLRIREVVPEDREAFREFFESLGPESNKFFNSTGSNSKIVSEYLDGTKKHYKMWAAVDESEGKTKIAGYVFIWDLNIRIPWYGIAVADGWQGHHVGTRLTNTAIQYCKENGYGGLMLITAKTNVKAQGLYEKCGFFNMGTHIGGQLFYILRFAK
ncbi:MAG: GNAT family N-acetyltransferase [Clostridia bacterium]|nr:GNAT family N-acetyltransferase [Clostridia bacterium]